jgi:hypothetical protein
MDFAPVWRPHCRFDCRFCTGVVTTPALRQWILYRCDDHTAASTAVFVPVWRPHRRFDNGFCTGVAATLLLCMFSSCLSLRNTPVFLYFNAVG